MKLWQIRQQTNSQNHEHHHTQTWWQSEETREPLSIIKFGEMIFSLGTAIKILPVGISQTLDYHNKVQRVIKWCEKGQALMWIFDFSEPRFSVND